MSRVAQEDEQMITHIEFMCNSIHDFNIEIYEDMMDRDYESAKEKTQKLIKVLSNLVQSMSDEI
mgnify:CR=1 FL=1